MVEEPAGPRFWRLLRRLYPRHYREEWADEVLRTHVDAAGGEARARGVRFWRRLVADALRTAIALRVEALMEAPGSRGAARRLIAGAQDTLRLAVGGLRRSAGFSLGVVLTLALGLGANVTIFTALNRLLLEPPAHVADAVSVRRITVHGVNPFSGTVAYSRALAYPDYLDLQTVSGFASVAAHTARTLTLGQGAEAERIHTEWATASYFPLLGVRPHVGRFYSTAEDRVGATPVVVLGWGLWRRRFHGDPGILGQTLRIGNGGYTVIGVAPRGFTGVDLAQVDAWLPLHTAAGLEQGPGWEAARQWYWFAAIARLSPSVPEASAEAQATVVYRNGRRDVRGADPNARVLASPLLLERGPQPSSRAQVIALLGLVAMLVLLIACANVANLFLARGIQRRRSLAVQSALGAGRGRIVSQLLAEAMLLAGTAAALGLGMAALVGPALFRALLGEDVMLVTSTVRVVVFTLVLATAAVCLGGAGPALRAARVDPFEALRGQRTSLRSSSLRQALLAVQAALSVILLIAAGLFLRSLSRAQRIDFGIDMSAFVVDLELDGARSSAGEIGSAVLAVVDRLRQHPAVESATVTNVAPFQGVWGLALDLPGPDSIDLASPRGPFYHAADPDYFRTLGLDIVQGRGITAADEHPDALPVVVVNRSMAREIWGSESAALGQCLLVNPSGNGSACTTVVGVASAVRLRIEDAQPLMLYYLPVHHPHVGDESARTILFRLREGRAAELGSVVDFIREAMPEIRYVDIRQLRDSVAAQLRAWQLGAVLLSVFGVLALIVAGCGLYSVLAFDVAQRRFELGIRSALGASPGRLLRTMVAPILLVTAAGMAAGVAGAAGLSRFITSLLFDVQPLDAWAYAAATLVLGVCAVLAAGLPAWRATRVDPRTTLAE